MQTRNTAKQQHAATLRFRMAEYRAVHQLVAAPIASITTRAACIFLTPNLNGSPINAAAAPVNGLDDAFPWKAV